MTFCDMLTASRDLQVGLPLLPTMSAGPIYIPGNSWIIIFEVWIVVVLVIGLLKLVWI